MRVALVHDWLTGMRGGEKVLERLLHLYPDAPIYTLVHHPGSVSEQIEARPIHTSFIQHLPAPGAYRWYLPVFPAAIRSLDLSGFDLVVSSSHCVAKSAITDPDAVHLCYCHTPMRYAWDQFDAYFSPRRNGRLRYLAIKGVMALLRRWDAATADRVDAFVANSGYVADRIHRYYGREAAVVSPPVDTERFTPVDGPPEDFYLVVSALSPYKRVDQAIEAFNRMQRRLIVVGWGPEKDALRKLAGPTVSLAGKVDDDTLLSLYRRCRGLVLPGIEDAGIAPLEAMACGRPALVLGEGGAPEAVIDGETGVHIREPNPRSIVAAVDRAEGLTFNTARIRAHAEEYSEAAFERRFRAFAERHTAGLHSSRPRSGHRQAPGARR